MLSLLEAALAVPVVEESWVVVTSVLGVASAAEGLFLLRTCKRFSGLKEHHTRLTFSEAEAYWSLAIGIALQWQWK